MKLSKIFFITIAIMFTVTNVFSQNMSIGLRTGATYFTINNDEINDDAKYTMGLNFAIPFEYSFSPKFAIQPELNFTQKGVLFEEMEVGENVEIAVKTNYFELPVLFKSKHQTGKFDFSLFVGPSIGYATKRFLVEKIGEADSQKMDVDFIDEGDAKSQRWEFSAVGGLSSAMNLGYGSLILDVRYSYGFSDNTKFSGDQPEGWEKTTNSGCILSLGYIIPIGG
ncbi:MAG: porin family protein [Saprospiraceae bacterium]|nr:porin family protein [Saprospiraceae bacterium]